MELLAQVDHLVYATPNVAESAERLAAQLGVRPAAGGRHPGKGTCNALVSLGPTTYLEIIGPDPAQPDPAQPRIFGIDDLTAPRLVTWVSRTEDVEGIVAAARERGIELGTVLSGTRERPDGAVLSWTVTDPHVVLDDGLAPFFIDWGATAEHPARTSPQGCTLLALRAEHPEPERVRATLEALGVPLTVEPGPAPALMATILCPRGIVELR